MAVTRMHTDPGKSYDPNKELTNTQRKRFSEIANKAEERREQRELYESVIHPQKLHAKAYQKLKQRQMKKAMLKSEKSPELTGWRVVGWFIVLTIFWLSIHFMFPSQ
ncbi:hypothetical protein R3X26_10440 [Vibrio sp. TH_r3]|uniref:hypothetical protein n=1 Tax=Vibrio sp. TH_r3 TaxID=3082084 RepID=UPI00295557E4|nr:hypothetical protein [Vibrio sp. TH_r3]MDV7104816.1 hypothetical protein [Vibrio sp. TH_r3]